MGELTGDGVSGGGPWPDTAPTASSSSARWRRSSWAARLSTDSPGATTSPGTSSASGSRSTKRLRRRVPGSGPAPAVRGEDRSTETLGRTPGVGDRVPKGGSKKHSVAEKRAYVRRGRPRGMSVAEGCSLMDLPRSTYYDAPIVAADDAAIVGRIQAICDEFETYGYRRVGAALRQQGPSSTARRCVD